MGMASSQARLLSLTARMHSIEYKAARIEAQKLQLANETRRVYEGYLDALDSTKIQYSSLNAQGAATYNDATYLDLFSGISGTQFILCTTDGDKICLTQKIYDAYKNSNNAEEFAKKLTTDGTIFTADTDDINADDTTTDNTVIDEENTEEEPEDDDKTVILTRKGSNSKNIQISNDDTYTIKLKNSIDGKEMSYTVTSRVNEVLPGYEYPTGATFTYLDNGRLLIYGSFINIVANEGQDDSLIVFGTDNNISTNSGNDIVRVGLVMDSLGGQSVLETFGNIIDTGAGNDYVEIAGGSNTINMGAGDDSLFQVYASPQNTVSSAETIFGKTNASDNAVGWSQQGGYGDCKFLSFLNSLNKPLSNFVTITKSGSNYNVLFKASNISVTVNSGDFNDSSNVKGDTDTIITEIAFRKYITEQGFNMFDIGQEGYNKNSLGSSFNNFLINEVFFNQDDCGQVILTNEKLTWLLNQYKSGSISSLMVGTKTDKMELGIYDSHAYAVKDGKAGEYVVLVNPHDSKDLITLDWSDFFNYYKSAILIGDTYTKYVNKFGANVEYESWSHLPQSSSNPFYHESVSVDNNGANIGGLTGQYNYFINLFNAISAAKGVQVIPANMINNKTYLSNIINSGYVYLKELNNKNNEWVDSSVATSTDLREVSDEILLKKAEAKYEADMKRIDLKERKYDEDLAEIETERNAIKQEMETLKTVTKENVERTFKLFS